MTDEVSDEDTATDADGAAIDDLESSPPTCPRCGARVFRTITRGPLSGSVRPCGCAVLPGALKRDGE
ncbi:hypothetical protein [Natrinema caseinilyticum]|uniref:hypothetical protein n=1 Tax=Natrinema caseinilyticum TaxID=2961570 RepID=UPI0020C1F146|nr:hypothetical protein [Natrinema caseinilyticum]